MRQLLFVFVALLAFPMTINAQSFLDDLKVKNSEGANVNVVQSKDLDELVDNAKLIKSTPSASSQYNKSGKNEPNHMDKHDGEHTRRPSDVLNRDTDTHVAVGEGNADAVNTNKKVMLNGRKTTGYRIQVYSGGNSRKDRQNAENTGRALKQRFPSVPVYVHFYSPRWICRMGNFRTYQEAESLLKEIKSMGYRQACIVKGVISVGY
ncbi:MAG: SPOR domain-containing protein [Prevotella sp.]|nr:SPOR domain-containing protein [Paraprevotella sp.]MCI6202180.1 SPOR domain-containing protein [Paraprevotella sp.]MDD5855131.1 SPOR domain-containing protein [Prevotella sp.]MDY4408599.1 SPOR domain-containing protein [Prevotella sp.]